MRTAIPLTFALVAGLSGAAGAVGAQVTHGQAHPAPAPGDAALVANALSAAPASVAATATVKAHDGRVLRQGTSDWVCLPDMPDVPNDSPMCLDAPWRDFMDAYMNKRTPRVAQVGFAYMLQGDMPVSNVDPFATGPTATNEWLQDGIPHIMILLPDPRLFDGLPTDPKNGGPFVMWRGTPYAHVMVPAPPPK